jgi:tetratricopeptide (TPR) repeat protein
MKNNLLLPVAACIYVAFASTSYAQLVDEVDFRQEGANAVAQIKFLTPVQYSRSISARASDLVQVFYTVLPNREQISVINSERRLPGGGDIPSMIISDEEATNPAQANVNRKLVIRFGSPVRFKVRAGRGNRSIEIVLEGLGASVKNVSVASRAPAELAGRYAVTLLSSTEAGKPLPSSIPANLQNYQVFTARRVTEGKTVYDTNLGYFSSRQEAATALAQVIKLFPGAALTELPLTTTTTKAPELPVGGVDSTAPPIAQGAAEVEASAASLLATAQSAFDSGNYLGATESLNQLLNLPPNSYSRKAQELAGLSSLNAGDSARAASEFKLFLNLYPIGEDSDRVRQLVTALPTIVSSTSKTKPVVEATSTTSGSVSMFYYGGKSDNNTITQALVDATGGVLTPRTEAGLSGIDQKQLQTNVDLNWRYRDAEKDMRFVFRDAYSADYIKNVGKERLSALYFDYRSFVNKTSVRVGRQSPNGGGVLYRFDGIQAGYAFKPKWKVNAVLGSPSDPLLDTRRMFYGLSVDAEALSKSFSGSAFVIEQSIDGQTDRRGLGGDLRYFSGGVSASAQVDYDQILKAVNVAAVQANWQVSEATALNAMIDRRTTPMLTLGNVLFFQNPALLAPARRIEELLGITPIESLREQVKSLTAYQTQARIGGTTSVAANWQAGADFSVTNVDEIRPVADLLPTGQASTGNLWSVGAQLIGSNLYSARDTHVFNVTYLGGPTNRGRLLSYNNLSSLNDKWQLEPSLKNYTSTTTGDGISSADTTLDTWTTGLRAIYRVHQKVSLETELTYEMSNTKTSATATIASNSSSATRLNYYIGGRYEF